MFSGRILLTALLSSVIVFGQAESIPAQLKSARTVFVVNETGDPGVLDMAHQFLASSRFTCIDDRKKADLLFKFGRIISPNEPSVMGNEISISVRNTFTLEVFDRRGARLWRDSAELHNPEGRSNKAERVRHPTAQLLDEFLALSPQKQ